MLLPQPCQKCMPCLKKGTIHWNTVSEQTFIDENYGKAENISIDFGVIEKANNVQVLTCRLWLERPRNLGVTIRQKSNYYRNENITIGGKAIVQRSYWKHRENTNSQTSSYTRIIQLYCCRKRRRTPNLP